MTNQRRWVVLLVAFALGALGCGSGGDSCQTYCGDLCGLLAQCSGGAAPTGCVNSCESGIGTTNCDGAPPAAQLTCAEASHTYACADYCSALCDRGPSCGGFNKRACTAGCATAYKTVCNAASVAARSCDQLKPELAIYEDRARSYITESWHSSYYVQTGVCATASDCPATLGCSAETNTCAACTTDAQCVQSNDGQYIRHACTNGACGDADCLIDTDCYKGWCDANGHVCRDCRTDADCTVSIWPVCNPATFMCVDCTNNAQCVASSNGIFTTCDLTTNSCRR